MGYKIKAIIYDPEALEDSNSDLELSMSVEFVDYGNAHHVRIFVRAPDGYTESELLDITCDDTYRQDHKFAYLTNWVEDCWNGEYGSYKLKSISICKV